ncbi:MAG: glycosyltransferase [Candidatus Omnitrophota bacterium]
MEIRKGKSQTVAMKKIKVLYLIDKLEIAGAQRHLVSLLKEIDRRRFEVSVVCLMHEGPLGESLRTSGIPLHSLHLRRIYGLAGLGALVRLVRYLKRERIDVVHTYLFSENIFGTVAARLAGTRMIVTGRRDTGKLREGKARHMLAYRFTNRWADRIVCVSEAVKRVVLAREKVSESKVVTIPNGTRLGTPLSQEEKAAERGKMGVSPEAFVVSIVANLSWIKGHETFFKAADLVRKGIPEAQFWVIGDGVLRGKLEAQVTALALTPNVRFFGRVPDPKQFLLVSDVSVNASFSEGMSNTILESMALGIPVVATGVDGNLETVVDGETGILVPPGDSEALANAVIRLAKSPDERRKMGEAARARIREVLSLEKMVGSVEKLYESNLSPKVQFIFSKFPCYDETFILREMRQLKAAGLGLSIFSLKGGKGPILHADALPLLEDTIYLPFFSGRVLWAQISMMLRHPLRYLSTLILLIARQIPDAEFLVKSLAIFPKSVLLARDLRKRGIHHLHAEWATYPATSAWIASRLAGIPFSFTGHAHDIYVKKTMLAEKLAEAAFIITCTEDNKRHLLTVNPRIPPGKIHVIYHGVELERFRRDGKAADGKLSLLSVGSLLECKGFDILIQACRRLKEEGVRFECRIVGGGPLEDALRRQVKDLGLEDTVKLLGYMKQEDLIAYYKKADLFALPVRLDRHWGIPNVLLEAMASEVPVICTPLPSIPELIQDKVNGFLVPDRDAQALSGILVHLSRDTQLREASAREGLRTVSEKFNAEKNARELIQLFKEKMPS